MKTPEEMAEEYVEAEFKGNGGNVSRAVCKFDFMSGFKAAIDLIHSNTTKDMSNLANAFAGNYFGKEYAVSFDSFLAGYQAAKDQLADADKVMCNTTMEEVKAVDIGELMPITNLPTSAKWISVKDRLPPDGAKVLLIVFGDINYGWIDQSPSDPTEYSLYFGNNYIDKGHHALTHWMSLPEPPKEDK